MRYGNQKPTFKNVGRFNKNRGLLAADMFGEYGLTFMPAQEYEFQIYLSRKRDGSPTAKVICVSKPRQNGKSHAARLYAIWMSAIEGKAVLYSAHNGDTVREMFKWIKEFVLSHNDFAKELLAGKKGIVSSTGFESIRFRNGGLINFKTRTKSGARGSTYAVIIIDEAQELTEDHLEALTPTKIASGGINEASNSQTIYLGTPPNEGCLGTVFKRYHDKVHNGESSIWWLEWGIDKLPDDVLDKNLWYRVLPGLGYIVSEEEIKTAYDEMTEEGFCREILGWWSETANIVPVIPEKEWHACFTGKPNTKGTLCYSVRFSQALAALSVGVKHEDGSVHVEIVDVIDLKKAGALKNLADWICARKEKACEVVVEGTGLAKTLYDDLTINRKLSKKQVLMPTTAYFTASTAAFVQAVSDGMVTHYIDTELDNAATKTTKRKIGKDGYGFQSTEFGEAALIESVCLAYYSATTTKRNPKRKTGVAF